MNDAMNTPQLPAVFGESAPRLLFVGGKGGVGKTSVSCAAARARAAAQPDKQHLIISTDPAHSTADAIAENGAPDNLTVVEFDAELAHASFLEANAEHLKAIATRGTFFDDSDVDMFLDLSLPGLDELMAFHTLATIDASGEYATITIDTAPTGHTLRLLGMPRFLETYLDAMETLLAKHRYMAGVFGSTEEDPTEVFLENLRETVGGLEESLQDPQQAAFLPVMLPETLSIAETARLLDELDDLRIAAPELVINRLIPAEDNPIATAIRSAQWNSIITVPEQMIQRDVWALPLLQLEPRGDDGLQALSQQFIAPGTIKGFLLDEDAEITELPEPAVDSPIPTKVLKDKSILLFAGKGGVGKTTTAASTATQLAASGTKTLILSTDPAHSLADALAIDLSDEALEVQPNLHAAHIDADTAFAAFKREFENEIEEAMNALVSGAELAFDTDAMRHLIDLAPPGLDELMALLRVIETLEEHTYDTVVLDTAPTGHLLRLLELPHLVSDWLNTLFNLILKYDNMLKVPNLKARLVEISRGAKQLQDLLTDSSRAGLVAVAIPTVLSSEETIDLLKACETLGVSVPAVIINQVTPAGKTPLFSAINAREAKAVAQIKRTAKKAHVSTITRGRVPKDLNDITTLGGSLIKAARGRKAA